MPLTLHRLSAVEQMQAPGLVMRLLHATARTVRGMGTNPEPCPVRPASNQPPPLFCRRLEQALLDDTVWFGLEMEADFFKVMDTMASFPEQFLALGDGLPDPIYSAAVILVPNLRHFPHDEFIEPARLLLSIEHYLPAGLMLGAFGRNFTDPYTHTMAWNHFLVVRRMIADDWPFFWRFPPQEQEVQRAAYQERFGTWSPP